MDLGYKEKNYPVVSEAPDNKPKTCYPTTRVQKDLGVSLGYDDYFTATVRFRVKNVENGENYSGDPRYCLELELCEMSDIKKAKTGLPQHRS